MSRTEPDECAERVDAATRLTEAHWRRKEAEYLDEITRLRLVIEGQRTQLALMQEQIEKNG